MASSQQPIDNSKNSVDTKNDEITTSEIPVIHPIANVVAKNETEPNHDDTKVDVTAVDVVVEKKPVNSFIKESSTELVTENDKPFNEIHESTDQNIVSKPIIEPLKQNENEAVKTMVISSQIQPTEKPAKPAVKEQNAPKNNVASSVAISEPDLDAKKQNEDIKTNESINTVNNDNDETQSKSNVIINIVNAKDDEKTQDTKSSKIESKATITTETNNQNDEKIKQLERELKNQQEETFKFQQQTIKLQQQTIKLQQQTIKLQQQDIENKQELQTKLDQQKEHTAKKIKTLTNELDQEIENKQEL
eukprot:255024_1